MTGAAWPSAFVAALFAVHPLHVESVAWVTERKDVLSTLLPAADGLAPTSATCAQPAVRRYLRRGRRCSRSALMSKPMVVTLPVRAAAARLLAAGARQPHGAIGRRGLGQSSRSCRCLRLPSAPASRR